VRTENKVCQFFLSLFWFKG